MRAGRQLVAVAALAALVCGGAAFGAETASSARMSRGTLGGHTGPSTTGTIAFRRYFDPWHSSVAVFTISAGGTDERQITHPPSTVLDDQPAWGPDGSSIAFSRCASTGPCQIYVVPPDGTGLAPLSAPCGTGADAQLCAQRSRSCR